MEVNHNPLRKHSYKVKKPFYVTACEGKQKRRVVFTVKGRAHKEGGYKQGMIYYDYTTTELGLAEITENLLENKFIELVF